MIEIDKFERQWILMCKGQLPKDKYPYLGDWTKSLKTLFVEIYGWNPDEDNNYDDYLRCIFNKLLDIYLKIKDTWSGENTQLKEIFQCSFQKSVSFEQDSSIERTINKLCSLIQFTTVIDKDGNKRFEI